MHFEKVVHSFRCLSKASEIEEIQEVNPFVDENLIYEAQSVGLCVCLNSSETATGTSIKLGAIDHHPAVSVIRVFVTS